MNKINVGDVGRSCKIHTSTPKIQIAGIQIIKSGRADPLDAIAIDYASVQESSIHNRFGLVGECQSAINYFYERFK